MIIPLNLIAKTGLKILHNCPCNEIIALNGIRVNYWHAHTPDVMFCLLTSYRPNVSYLDPLSPFEPGVNQDKNVSAL